MSLEKGQQVGNYVVESEIGEGGMARLYRVRHAVLGTLHALKVLNAEHRANPEVRGRFLGEAMIGARLNHPAIVRVTDTVATEEVAAIVMELVQGPNLEQYVRGLPRLPTADEIRQIFLPILDALGEAHRRGIIHRDIKPGNILLETHGTGLRAKLTDFGIAKVTEAAADVMQKKRATHADAKMGTLAYMSPEQIQRAAEVTQRSDIFSLGATLYELATGHAAFDGHSDYDVMHKIVEGRVAPAELIPGVDPTVAAVIRRALHPDPAQRFASCEEFAQALQPRAAPLALMPVSTVTAPSPPVFASPQPMTQPPPWLVGPSEPRALRPPGTGGALANPVATASFVVAMVGIIPAIGGLFDLLPISLGMVVCSVAVVLSGAGLYEAIARNKGSKDLAVAGLVLGLLFLLPVLFRF